MLKRIPKTLLFALCFLLLLGSLSNVYGQTYLIRPGDSLWRIANQFSVSVLDLKAENNLPSDLIIAGEELKIPQVHIVARGDTLWRLAQNYGTTIDRIMNANKLSGSTIFVGQRLNIPSTIKSTQSVSQTISVTSHERELLARAVYSEARGEPFQGQVAVAAVVLNRVRHPEFPNTISGVIYEPWAFTAVHDGQFWLTPNQAAYTAVQEALRGNDPSQGAIFYYNPVTATNQWIRTRPIITQIGRHVFAR